MNNDLNSSVPQGASNTPSTKQLIRSGLRDGFPIGLGYFAVSFSLGIAARNAGLDAFQGFLASLLTNASAGEYAGFSLIAEHGALWEMILVTLIANARYLLMACSLSQRLPPRLPLRHRLGLGFYLTDELFGITIARPGQIRPMYTYGAALIAAPCWAFGTAFGILLGNILPLRVVSALSVSLYGMFLAIIIPPARKNRVIALLIAVSFLVSFAAANLPVVSSLSGGTRTILLTIGISSVAALLFPVKQENQDHV